MKKNIILILTLFISFFGINFTYALGETEVFTITIIDDKRCTDCQTDNILKSLKETEGFENVKIKKIDFSDKKAKIILDETGINRLPAFFLSNNNVEKGMKGFLVKTKNGKFYLNVGSSFNPYSKRSDKGNLIINDEILKNIKNNSYIKGNNNAQITWVNYSDLECPFCAKLYNVGTPKYISEKYGDKLNMIFNHFPLEFHRNAYMAAQILECSASQKGSEVFYELTKLSYVNQNSNKDFLIKESVKLGVNKKELVKCVEDKKFDIKIKKQQNLGQKEFNITGTPGSVIINNITGEYKVISGAYPTEYFEKTIDSLLIDKEYFIKKMQIISKKLDIKLVNKIDRIIKKLNIFKLKKFQKEIPVIRKKIENKKIQNKELILNILDYINLSIENKLFK